MRRHYLHAVGRDVAQHRVGSKLRCAHGRRPAGSKRRDIEPAVGTAAQVSVTSAACFPGRSALTFSRRNCRGRIAPFGRPVVPEVYMMIATSSTTRSASASGWAFAANSSSARHDGATSSWRGNGGNTAGCAPRRSPRHAPSAISACTPRVVDDAPSSGPVRRKLSGTNNAPSEAARAKAREMPVVEAEKPDRSPRLTPAWRTPAAGKRARRIRRSARVVLGSAPATGFRRRGAGWSRRGRCRNSAQASPRVEASVLGSRKCASAHQHPRRPCSTGTWVRTPCRPGTRWARGPTTTPRQRHTDQQPRGR